jgi:imidazolonepropionase-like amidohydrolase
MRCAGLSEEEALKLITINAAKQLGIDHRTGSLDVGKDADIVIWNGHPLSTYSRVNTTLIDGEVFFQERDAHNIKPDSTYRTKLGMLTYVPNPPLPPRAKSYAITNAEIHSVIGPVISGGTVLVQNGRIVQVGTNVKVPAGVVSVDAKGLRVYPGFIDATTSIGLTEFGQVGQATDASELGNFQPDLIAATAVNVQTVHAPIAYVQGVTSVLTAPTGGTVSGWGSVLNLRGGSREEMTLKAKAGLMLTWPGGGGAGNFDEGAFEKFVIDDLCDNHLTSAAGITYQGGGSSRELEDFWEKAARYGRAHTKRDAALEAMQPVFTRNARVFIRVRNASGIRSAVDWVKKRKLDAVLIGVPDAWKEAKLLADSKIPVIIEAPAKALLTANVTISDWDPYDTPYACAALLKRAGVKFAFMTGGYTEVMNLVHRAGSTCAYGMKPKDVVRALTQDAADILGVGDQIGSLVPGKIANLVVTDGDPFELTTSFRYVFINGQPVPLTSKHTQLRDQYLARVQ